MKNNRGNHIPIFTCSGMEVRKYRYYDTGKSSVDFDGLLKDLSDAPNGSAVLLHACAHNPTGMDPSMEQWEQISKVMLQKKMLPFFDCAYQGFASGNAPKDAAAIRLFVKDGHHLAVVQSFSKNFGLYGQRVGALSVVTGSDHEAQAVLSQLKIVIRSNYSNPPRFGAAIVSEILSDSQMTDDFISQCEAMASRIGTMRQQLRSNLEQVAPQRSWSHITQQIGMFAYSGLSKEECEALRDKHHIYCTLDGRISMAGVTSENVQYLADSIGDVIQ
jgi:aspartate aminotransferase